MLKSTKLAIDSWQFGQTTLQDLHNLSLKNGNPCLEAHLNGPDDFRCPKLDTVGSYVVYEELSVTVKTLSDELATCGM
jgi:hypothetical protein